MPANKRKFDSRDFPYVTHIFNSQNKSKKIINFHIVWFVDWLESYEEINKLEMCIFKSNRHGTGRERQEWQRAGKGAVATPHVLLPSFQNPSVETLSCEISYHPRNSWFLDLRLAERRLCTYRAFAQSSRATKRGLRGLYLPESLRATISYDISVLDPCCT